MLCYLHPGHVVKYDFTDGIWRDNVSRQRFFFFKNHFLTIIIVQTIIWIYKISFHNEQCSRKIDKFNGSLKNVRVNQVLSWLGHVLKGYLKI